MHDVELVEVFDTSNDLVEEFERLRFFHSLVLHDVVEELAAVGVFHD